VGSSEQYRIVDSSELPETESQELRPIGPYAVACVTQEACAKLYHKAYGLDIVVTKSFNHIGPG
jgi:GDP-4-dehydro-6-deoxy-D-mannose reductase